MKSSRRSITTRPSASASSFKVPTPNLGQGMAPPPSRITMNKWAEIQKEEYANRMVNSIREEIVQRTMKILFQDYLMKNSCSFIVKCAQTAWLQLFNWMNLKSDPCESTKTVEENWTVDEEHPSVPMENWVFGNVPIRKKSAVISQTKICENPCEQEDATRILPENISSPPRESPADSHESADKIVLTPNKEPSIQPVYQHDSENVLEEKQGESFEGEENEITTNDYEAGGESSDRSEALSIFTRTINMPKQELPISRWSSVKNPPILRGNDVSHQKARQSWKLDNVKPPKKLSLARPPPNRCQEKEIIIIEPQIEERLSLLSDETMQMLDQKIFVLHERVSLQGRM